MPDKHDPIDRPSNWRQTPVRHLKILNLVIVCFSYLKKLTLVGMGKILPAGSYSFGKYFEGLLYKRFEIKLKTLFTLTEG